MHDVITFLKGAVARGPTAGLMGCYIVGRQSISARNTGLQAGIALESAIEFNVPAVELEEVLARIETVQSIAYDEDKVTIRSGRVRATIKCNQEAPPSLPVLPDDWAALPEAVLPALKLASAFVTEQGWSSGVRLRGDYVTAISNTSGIDINVPGLDAPEVLLPPAAVAFIVEQGAPAFFAVDDSAAMFKWEDGRWLRAQLMVVSMPALVDKIFSDAGNDAPVEITREWREAFADAAALSDGTIQMTKTQLKGFRGAARNEIDVESPVAAEHLSYWSAEGLKPVIENATHWNPDAYPKPTFFVGPFLRGIVVGVRR